MTMKLPYIVRWEPVQDALFFSLPVYLALKTSARYCPGEEAKSALMDCMSRING